MEESFGLSFGYPALMAMSHSKQKFSVMRGSFSERNVKKFVLGLMAGKERL
jgi:protein disulfide-isomerase A6